jgi:chromosome condensin MukBEF complex kleisin-like MukF subunit
VENYFNYFTEIEECFQRARGSPTMLSTLDWALIESWKEAGLPLEAVLTGIDRAFEKYHKRPRQFRKVNSLAYCSQEVMRAAEAGQMGEVEGRRPRARETEAPFAKDEVFGFVRRNAEVLQKASESMAQSDQGILVQDIKDVSSALDRIAAGGARESEADLEELERHLTALEEKLAASLTRASSAELLATFRGEIERALVSYRRNLSAAELESLERQFIKKRLFEHYHIPRLSLFYM